MTPPPPPELDLVLSCDHSTAIKRYTAVTPLIIPEFIYCFVLSQ